MNWIRGKLRTWLCPELDDISLTVRFSEIDKQITKREKEFSANWKRVEKNITEINSETEAIQQGVIKKMRDESGELHKELISKKLSLLQDMDDHFNRTKEYVESELQAMYFRFDGKQAPVKDLVRTLLKYLKLRIVIHKSANRELKIGIEKITTRKRLIAELPDGTPKKRSLAEKILDRTT